MRGLMYGEPSLPATANARVKHLSGVDSSQLPRTARTRAPPRTSGGRSTESGLTVHPEHDPRASVMQSLIYGGNPPPQRVPAKARTRPEDYEAPLARRGPPPQHPIPSRAPSEPNPSYVRVASLHPQHQQLARPPVGAIAIYI